VINWALVAGASTGLRWAFYGGIALDVCASTMLGSHALALLLAVVAVLLLVRRIRGEHWLIPIAGTFLGTLVYESVLAAIYTWHGPALEWRTYAVIVLLPSALLATVPALPIYMLMRQIVRQIQDGSPER
jgi:rod shape-determining protein MreD